MWFRSIQILVGLLLVGLLIFLSILFYQESVSSIDLIQKLSEVENEQVEVVLPALSTSVSIIRIADEFTIIVRSDILDVNIQQVGDIIRIGNKTIDIKGFELLSQQAEYYGNDLIVKIELTRKEDQ